MKLLIRNGRVIDPANNLDAQRDILIEGVKIAKVDKGIRICADSAIDAAGKIVMPGIVDMHVHLREPGREDKETIASGTAAALKGGVTTLLAMPNTEPVMDDSESIKLFKEIIRRDARANVLICGAITKARAGKVLTDVAALKKSDVVALSDDGASVDDDNLMLEALKRTRAAGILMLAHCQDNALFGKGVVNRGPVATRLGLRGISAESEYKRLQRDIGLAQKAASRLHITHISCKESVAAIARAKKEGINLTCDVTPHHLAFSEEAVLGYDTNFKMNPPLRSSADQEALKDGLKDGTIDAIASDHAPHTENEKDIEFERAEFGVIGLETELSAAITGLVETNLLSWLQLVEKLCLNPAKILGIDKPGPYVQGLGKGSLGEGREADIIIVDPQKEWLVSRNNLVSRSKNSAFLGRTLKGLVTHTILAGKVVYSS